LVDICFLPEVLCCHFCTSRIGICRLAAEPAHSEVDRTIIRIHSEHQWPTSVAIDTNVKTINPTIRDDFPPSPVDPNRSQDKSKNEAFAYASALLL
jgi:hypothetical protein